MKTRINSIIAITTLLLSGCGGGDGEESALDKLTNGSSSKQSALDDLVKSSSSKSSSNSSQSSSSGTVADLSYLDCNQLDPSKVYLVGSLANSPVTGYDAIIDLDDYSKFCVGFPANAHDFQISNQGTVYYRDELKMMGVIPDTLNKTSETSTWNYPDAPVANDTNLFTTTISPEDTWENHINGNDIYFKDEGVNIYKNGMLHFTNIGPASFRFLGVTSDGSLLISESWGNSEGVSQGKLFIIDSDFNKTQLTYPESISSSEKIDFYPTLRLFNDIETGHKSAWIISTDTDVFHPTERRWSIDLDTLTIKDDGLFAAIPDVENTQVGIDRPAKLDGQGNLIQGSLYLKTIPSYIQVLKRPIASSNISASILYSESLYSGAGDWRVEPLPFVHVYSGFELITGQ